MKIRKNDVSENDTRIYQQTGDDYFEDFTDFDFNADPYLFLDPGYRNLIQKAQYQGETWLGITGEDQNPSSIDSGCEDLDKILEENFGFDGRIEFCVDVTGLSNPTLSFDMVQFTKESPFLFPEEFTTVLTIDLTGNEFEPMRIYGQPQGEIQTHYIPIPLDFDGRIGMEAFTMLGDNLLFIQERYDDGNVILLDNIRISNGPVKTTELTDNQLITVFPNPASDAVWFENISDDFSDFDIEIFNTLGAKIFEINDASGKTEWKTEGQQPGVYFYKINREGEQIDAGKLILEK